MKLLQKTGSDTHREIFMRQSWKMTHILTYTHTHTNSILMERPHLIYFYHGNVNLPPTDLYGP